MRTPLSTWSRATRHVIRISDVLIISMLTPPSARARNMRAAMPGVPSIPVPTIDSLAMPPAEETRFAPTSCAGGIAKLSIVGTGMLGTPGIAARMFRALADGGVNIEMISTSEIRITCLVARDQVEKGVRVLHKAFELDQELA